MTWELGMHFGIMQIKILRALKIFMEEFLNLGEGQ